MNEKNSTVLLHDAAFLRFLNFLREIFMILKFLWAVFRVTYVILSIPGEWKLCFLCLKNQVSEFADVSHDHIRREKFRSRVRAGIFGYLEGSLYGGLA